jgi:nucleotide-binding universal stress UspA family protein
MRMFTRILIASDGSGPSIRAARVGALIGKAFSAQVTVLTVASVPERYKPDLGSDLEEGYVDEWKHALDATVREMKRQGVEPATRFVREESVVPAILDELKGGGYDLLVVGRTGAGNPASKAMGSTSDRLTSEVVCSLLVVR